MAFEGSSLRGGYCQVHAAGLHSAARYSEDLLLITSSGSLLVTGDTAAPTWLLLSSSLLYSRSPGTNGVTAVLLITSLLSHLSSALRHLVALARLHGVHDLNKATPHIELPPRDLPSLAHPFSGAYTLETHLHIRPTRSYIDVLASTTPTTQYRTEPLKGHHPVVPATTRSFPSSVAVLVAPFELQPAPSTLQHKPPHTKTYPKTYFDPGLTNTWLNGRGWEGMVGSIELLRNWHQQHPRKRQPLRLQWASLEREAREDEEGSPEGSREHGE
ncbi:hypothetical protein F5877DRAFT_86466 [Lentinula edodes]|nr:hypothetical protein F5877DRAFT_86466 [Lentinula edodes]